LGEAVEQLRHPLRDWGKPDAALRSFERAIELDESCAKGDCKQSERFERSHQFVDRVSGAIADAIVHRG